MRITALQCSLLCQHPSHTASSISCRLAGNTIGDKGVSALAAILKETQITELQCAPIESVRFLRERR